MASDQGIVDRSHTGDLAGVSAAKGVASAIGRKLQERKAGSSATNTKPAAAGKAGAKAQDMSTFVSNGPYPFGRK